MTDSVRIKGLHKTFGRTRALDGPDLTVHTGEVHGFLGPNGAGKSTTIRIRWACCARARGPPWWQLTENSRSANGMAAGALAIAFLLRAAGDAGGPGTAWLSWLSPIGWTQQVRPFAAERWWVLGLALASAAGLVATARVLVARRDIGSGLLPPWLGPPEADPGVRTPLGLAWRLQRGALAGWTTGFLVFGAAFGSLAVGVGDLIRDNPQMAAVVEAMGMTGDRLIDASIGTMLGQLGVLAAAFAVQATLRLRSEESFGRVEPVLATGVGRLGWAASHLVPAAAGTVVLMVAAGAGVGLAHGPRAGDVGGWLPRVLAASLAHVPAALVMAGITMVLVGVLPRFTVAAWALLALFLVLGRLGPMLQLDEALMDLSPFAHTPNVLLPGATLPPLAWLAGAAVALMALGMAGVRRRDIG